MPVIKHAKTATAADDPAAEINKTEWNDEHTVSLGSDENFVTASEKALIAALPDCPILLYIKALAQNAGNLSLLDNTNWNTSKSLLYYIKVVTAATDWNLTLYPDNNFNDAGLFPSMLLVANRTGNVTLEMMMPYWDTTNLKKIYLNFTDNTGTATADIYITGVQAK